MRDPDRDPEVIRARAVMRWSKATDIDRIEAAGVLSRRGDWIDGIEARLLTEAAHRHDLSMIDAAMRSDWRPWALMAVSVSVVIAFAFF